jgi:hypothetical protein
MQVAWEGAVNEDCTGWQRCDTELIELPNAAKCWSLTTLGLDHNCIDNRCWGRFGVQCILFLGEGDGSGALTATERETVMQCPYLDLVLGRRHVGA